MGKLMLVVLALRFELHETEQELKAAEVYPVGLRLVWKPRWD